MLGKNAYTTKQVADNLGIVTSTLRKWCLMLEDDKLGGYKFERNERDQRVFYDYDIIALRYLQKLTQEDGITLENAIKTVGDKYRMREDMTASDSEGTPNNIDIESVISRYDEKIDRLLEHVEQQERFNRELISKLDEQQKYINESLNKRDQQLLTAMRDVQETKKLIAAAEEKREERKGLFAKLFGK